MSARWDLTKEEATLAVGDSGPSPERIGDRRRQGHDCITQGLPRLVVDDRPPDFDSSCWTPRRRPGLLPYQQARDCLEEEHDGPHG